MIRIDNEDYLSFCKFLEDKYPVNKDVFIYIHDDYTTVIDEETDTIGFGVYYYDEEEDRAEIHVATLAFKQEMETELDFLIAVYSTIAHEYAHHMQHVNGKRYSERKAEKFATRVVEEFLGFKLSFLAG